MISENTSSATSDQSIVRRLPVGRWLWNCIWPIKPTENHCPVCLGQASDGGRLSTTDKAKVWKRCVDCGWKTNEYEYSSGPGNEIMLYHTRKW